MIDSDILRYIEELERVNEELARLSLKKKELSDRIIESSRKNDIIPINSLVEELGNNENRIIDLKRRKEELLKNIKSGLKSIETQMDNFNTFCNYNGIISVTGLPGTGKLVDMIFRFINYCSSRDSVVMVLSDRERIFEMVRKISKKTDIMNVNPVYVEKVSDIKNIDQVSRLATRLSKDIMRIIRDKRNPIIVFHRSNDLSLDRIREVSNVLKEEFWLRFIENISPRENNILLIFNCDDVDGECTNLMIFSDYLIRSELSEGRSRFLITKLRL